MIEISFKTAHQQESRERAAQLDPAGLAQFTLTFLAAERATCEADIAANTVPYGVRLDDDHHGTCYRIEHIEQRATTGGDAAARIRIAPPSSAAAPTLNRWGLPPQWSDVIVY